MFRNSDLEIRNSITLARPKLLLHACCAPCSIAVYEKLCADYDLVLYWYNPNIFPVGEHDKRLGEIKKLSGILGFGLIIDQDSSADYNLWQANVRGLEEEPEGGRRCQRCYRLRLAKAAKYAKEKSFNYFATILTVSPYKNTLAILKIGQDLAAEYSSSPPAGQAGETRSRKHDSSRSHHGRVSNNIKFLAEDFKSNNGYRRSIELSKQFGLYRQNYCGCEYSLPKQKWTTNNTNNER